MLFLDGVILFISGYLSKNRLSILSYVLMLTILPLASMMIMVAEINYSLLDFWGYIAVMALTGVAFLSVWAFPAKNGECKCVELSMYIVITMVLLLSLALFAMAEVLPEDIIRSLLGTLISKGNTYDIWSRPPYQLAHFVVMAGCFPYIAAFTISKTILKFRRYRSK